MRMAMKKIFLSAAFLFLSVHAYAQFPEDALRYSSPGLGVGARSLGMGMAYTGVANDFSATYWNPAGLGQIRMNEMSLGLANNSFSNTSTLYNNSQSLTNSATSLNNIGLVYPFPTERGSLVIAVGYNRQADFTTGLSFNGFNTKSSIIQSWAPDLQKLSPDVSLAEQLYLAYADTITQRFVSPITGNLTQSGKVLESGGLNNVTVSGAFEAEKNLYIGATLNFITGSYKYTRNYYEDDLAGVYDSNTVRTYNNNATTSTFDFQSLSLTQTVESDLSGFSAKFGMLYKFAPGSRVGFTIKTPSLISVRELFSQSASSTFDNGDRYTYPSAESVPERNDYDVTTPFVFSAGFSHSIGDLMIAGDVEYTDWTQMEFSNADTRLLSYNTEIKQLYQPTANLHAGAEYEFSATGFRLRGGYAYLPSPYSGDPASFAQKYITAGLGFVVQDAIAFDIGYAHGTWNTKHANYVDPNNNVTSETEETVKTNNFIVTTSFRF